MVTSKWPSNMRQIPLNAHPFQAKNPKEGIRMRIRWAEVEKTRNKRSVFIGRSTQSILPSLSLRSVLFALPWSDYAVEKKTFLHLQTYHSSRTQYLTSHNIFPFHPSSFASGLGDIIFCKVRKSQIPAMPLISQSKVFNLQWLCQLTTSSRGLGPSQCTGARPPWHPWMLSGPTKQ